MSRKLWKNGAKLLLRKFIFLNLLIFFIVFIYCPICWCNFFVIEGLQRSSMHMVWDNNSSVFQSGQWSGDLLDNGREIVCSEVIWAWNSSNQRRLRSHLERTMIFERTLVWSEVTLVWDGPIRGNFELDLNLCSHFSEHCQLHFFSLRPDLVRSLKQ